MRLIALFAALSLCSCSSAAPPSAELSSKPMRIVSLDYCADQYVLKMVERSRILALSPDAAKPFSYMRGVASGIPTVKSSAENVLTLQPDLIVRSYGGGPNAARFFESANIPVLNVGWASDIAGIETVVSEMATGLGAQDMGKTIIADMRARIAALPKMSAPKTALYLTPGGVTSGTGSLVDEVIKTAGLTNFETDHGWRDIPLERLAYEQPDHIAAAFYDTNNHKNSAWSAARHPIAKTQMKERPTSYLPGAVMSCTGWWVVDAVEALAQDAAAQ